MSYLIARCIALTIMISDRHLHKIKKEEFSHGNKNARDWSDKGGHLMKIEQEGKNLE